ncbi:hypothetical protein [Micromonospora endophytica]|uniref:Uncharacterized protein n=1 Tax=Micromonospora endophytica TaxID=515350 RepID=A0A2W2C8N0_9ACTN|nr:hypothetical protein [Micromonospora endophytica]PZF88288.1 hypothetical protein C1I93_25170 [Micromonospora endophytica]RIW45236.1 hypothetical protein D3H59_15745 [Micromonospora endophytica]BCJ59545.1 hypothetical protein Jiend_29670 [Micromonospora endophytica]
MSDSVGLPPHRHAALVAPAVDRVCIAAMQAGRDGGGAELSQRYGGPTATGFLVELRTRLAIPGGTVDGAGFAAVTRYRDPIACRRIVDRHVAYGMVHRAPDGALTATERGLAFLTELYQVHAEVTEELWAGHEDRVLRLTEIAGRLLAAASAPELAAGSAGAGHSGAGDGDGPGSGSAFAALAPPHEPDGTPAGVLLLNRLGTLRYHRADAHAAAWEAAGHTPPSITELPDGAQRRAIELETDRRAAGPYATLTAAERLELLADLAALPG